MLEADDEVVVGSVFGLEGSAGREALCPSTWPRSRVGSMIFRTRFLSSFVSREGCQRGVDGDVWSGRGTEENEMVYGWRR